MSDNEDISQYLGLNQAHGKMVGNVATKVYIRDFPPLVSDEPPARGGEDRGQSSKGLILAALCAI